MTSYTLFISAVSTDLKSFSRIDSTYASTTLEFFKKRDLASRARLPFPYHACSVKFEGSISFGICNFRTQLYNLASIPKWPCHVHVECFEMKSWPQHTLFHRMYYGEAPELLCQLLPEHLQLDPCLRRSVRSHDLAVQIPRSNLVSHKRSFVPSAARIWNSLPECIPSLEKRPCFKKEVNRYLGDN